MKTCLVLLLVLAPALMAQVPADRDILLNAEGGGQGMYAEQNGYPGPKHVLDMADKLGLSKEQRTAVGALYADMAKRAKDIGKQIVRIEEELNAAFADRMVSEKTIRDDCEEIGRLRGSLRSVHLSAHLKCRAVLKDDQVALYRKLRAAGH